jgi:hypothetical protein
LHGVPASRGAGARCPVPGVQRSRQHGSLDARAAGQGPDRRAKYTDVEDLGTPGSAVRALLIPDDPWRLVALAPVAERVDHRVLDGRIAPGLPPTGKDIARA